MMNELELGCHIITMSIPSAAILLLLMIYALIRARRGPSGRLPPGPRPLLVVGNLPMVGDKPHRSLAALAKIYGPVMAVKLGQVTTIVISSPDVARQVLQKQDKLFYGRSAPDAVRGMHQQEMGLCFRSMDEHWRWFNKLSITHLFAPLRQGEAHARLLERKARELAEYVRECSAVREVVDVSQVTFTTVMNLITNALFSKDMADLRSSGSGSGSSTFNFKHHVREILREAGSPNMSDFFPRTQWFDFQGRRRGVTRSTLELFKVFDELIDEKMKAKAAKNNDFLDSLIHQHLNVKGNDQGLKMERGNIKALLLEMFVAGTDTTTSTVEWAMTELLRNPESMEKVQFELLQAIDATKGVLESDIPHLPYLNAVVKETFRMHTPTPFLIPRQTVEDVELCGYVIPEGTRVLVNAWGIGRDGDVWAKPDTFTPERFIGKDIDYKGRDFELFPFGAGRRICPGLPLASKMVHLILASLLHSFKWELPNGMSPMEVDMTENFGVSLVKANPLQAIPLSLML